MNSTQQQLSDTVARIYCHDETPEQWTKQIACEVTAVLSEFYGEVTQQMVEHAVCETLHKIATHLRKGTPVCAEYLGTLLPAQYQGQRCVSFRPDPLLTLPLKDARPPIVLDDRREVPHG
jgi:hypothetical protein